MLRLHVQFKDGRAEEFGAPDGFELKDRLDSDREWLCVRDDDGGELAISLGDVLWMNLWVETEVLT